MSFVLGHSTLVNRKLTIKSHTDVTTSLGTILTLCPTLSVLSAALSNNKNVLVFYVLANNLLYNHEWPITFVVKIQNVHGVQAIYGFLLCQSKLLAKT